MEAYDALLFFICLNFSIIKKFQLGFGTGLQLGWLAVWNYCMQTSFIHTEAALWSTNCTVSTWKRLTLHLWAPGQTSCPEIAPVTMVTTAASTLYSPQSNTRSRHGDRWVCEGRDWLSEASCTLPVLEILLQVHFKSTSPNSQNEEAEFL